LNLPFSVRALSGSDDRSQFRCGQPDLDDWFHRRAGQDERRNVARVFVAVDPAIGIVGFYTLSSFTISLPDLPTEIGRKLPRYGSIPTALIGRLARDERVRGTGVGEILLADAVRRVLQVAATIAIFAIVVEAKDENAADFYKSFGFVPFPDQPARLFMMTSTVEQAREAADKD